MAQKPRLIIECTEEYKKMVEGLAADNGFDSYANYIKHLININKTSGGIKMKLNELVENGTMKVEMADYLISCVKSKKNITVIGNVGSGKTTLVRALSEYIPDSERIAVVEKTEELNLKEQHPNIRLTQIVNSSAVLNNIELKSPERILFGELTTPEDHTNYLLTTKKGIPVIASAYSSSPEDYLIDFRHMLQEGYEIMAKRLKENADNIDTIANLMKMTEGHQDENWEVPLPAAAIQKLQIPSEKVLTDLIASTLNTVVTMKLENKQRVVTRISEISLSNSQVVINDVFVAGRE